jgi:hypothetical protein
MVTSDVPWGTVVQAFGRYFAGRVDLLTLDGFKATAPIDSLSPFSVAAGFDPEMASWAEAPRVTDRLRTDLLKDLAERLKAAHADFLVVDNTSALLPIAEINCGLYTMVGDEPTDFMDHHWNNDPDSARESVLRPADDGFTDRWRDLYDRFVAQCLEAFPPERIILVRSHVPRFAVEYNGRIAPVPGATRAARFLADLDEHFIRATSCLVSDVPLGFFPLRGGWHDFPDDARVELERDIRRLCMSPASRRRQVPPNQSPDPSRRRLRQDVDPQAAADDLARLSEFWGEGFTSTAADHIADRAGGRGKPDEQLLCKYFRLIEATPDDLLALAYLHRDPELRGFVAACVRHAVSDPHSHPSVQTRRRYDENVAALTAHPGCETRRALRWPAEPRIVLRLGHGRFRRFEADGRIKSFTTDRELDVEALASGETALSLEMVEEAVRSWPFYLERGRRGVTSAPVVRAKSPEALAESCYWLDWKRILDEESFLITTAASPSKRRLRRLPAKVDLSFLFHEKTRIASVTGGLMDQLKFIGSFADACNQAGVEAYYDDLIYLHKRIHDGFVASWLNPALDERRLSRRISQSLANRFREEARRIRKTWIWINAFTLVSLGLKELAVYTTHRRLDLLMSDAANFPVVVYRSAAMLRDVLARVTPGVALFAGQDQLSGQASATLLQEFFDFAALPYEAMNEHTWAARERLLAEPAVALHIRRGDYVRDDLPSWHGETDHYRQAVEFVARSEKFDALRPLNLVVFSDDAAFVRERHAELGLDFADGFVMVVDWNKHFRSVYDSYLMSLCPVIIGAVGGFAVTTALLAHTPNYFVRATPEGPELVWEPDAHAAVPRRGAQGEPCPRRGPEPRRRRGGRHPRPARAGLAAQTAALDRADPRHQAH